jgi:chemotaxis protein MotA
LFLFPIGAKLKTLIQKQSQYREMLIEGLVAIAEGENPRSIEMKLRGFIT